MRGELLPDQAILDEVYGPGTFLMNVVGNGALPPSAKGTILTIQQGRDGADRRIVAVEVGLGFILAKSLTRDSKSAI